MITKTVMLRCRYCGEEPSRIGYQKYFCRDCDAIITEDGASEIYEDF